MAPSDPIAVIFGGPSPEHDVSVLTGLQAARQLSTSGRSVACLYWSKTGSWHQVPADVEAEAFLQGIPRGAQDLTFTAAPQGGFAPAAGRLGRSRPLALDVAVICCHGGPGEDGTLQAALDLAGVRYAGPTAAGAALGMDKLAFAGVMAAAGLPVLPRRLLHLGMDDLDLPAPYIVKPRYGGSSIGVEVVEDLGTALARLQSNPHLRRGAVVEPFRGDLRDVNIAVRSWPQVSASAIERPLRGAASAEILGYGDKYVGGEGMASAPRELPADLPDDMAAQVRQLALEVALLCDLRGIARVDFLAGEGGLFVNEVNTIPGSLARYLWVDPPVSFAQLLEDMVDEARSRPSAHHDATGADGSVLRSAGSIASKLA